MRKNRDMSAQRVQRETPTTVVEFALDALQEVVTRNSRITFPTPRYRSDPVGFFRDILGVEVWDKQRELVESVRDYDFVACRAGHKISKTFTAAGLALWFYCSYPSSRVFITAPTDKQVNGILYREIKRLHVGSGICLACRDKVRLVDRPCPHSAVIDGLIAELARTGIKSQDFREITGATARDPEAIAGLSAPSILIIIDEASGVPDRIYEALIGNLAGAHSKLLCISNPTRTEGFFADVFLRRPTVGESSDKTIWKQMHLSSTDSPNVRSGRNDIPGLASLRWVEERKQEWGEDSALYKVRVLGDFILGDESKAISHELILAAEERWEDMPAIGRLVVSVDPAGEGGMGDESAFALRRGNKILQIRTMRGLSAIGHVSVVRDLISHEWTSDEQPPKVIIDREGDVGSKVWGEFTAHMSVFPRAFELQGFRASLDAPRQADIYPRCRDLLWANLRNWLKSGGAIPEDSKLEAELHCAEFTANERGELKLTPKEKIRKHLGRSTDRADAVALAVWTEDSDVEPGRVYRKLTTQGALARLRERTSAFAARDALEQRQREGERARPRRF